MNLDPSPRTPLRVVVAGGGIAGAESLLALRDLVGDRAEIMLVSPSTELVLPPLSVGEAFALSHAPRYELDELLARVGAGHIPGVLAAVDSAQREITLKDGVTVAFDALVIAVGAKPVERVQHATTWWPRSDSETFHGLLRDLEEGYTKRVAFVIPPGAVWPLPLYEIALMTARQVFAMGIDDAELTVITPEALPLALFGAQAATALRDELATAGVRLEAATVARIERGHKPQVVLAPSNRRLEVDRVVALPGVEGPRIPGTTQDEDGFVRVDRYGKMLDADSVWAAGDAVAYPVKFGGLAAQQADAVAADIARSAGVEVAHPSEGRLTLRGVLMTGATPRALGTATDSPSAPKRMWQPAEKVFGEYLTPYLREVNADLDRTREGTGVVVEETLPEQGGGEHEDFHALWREGSRDPDHLRRLGHDIHEYEVRHRQSAEILRDHGQLGGRR